MDRWMDRNSSMLFPMVPPPTPYGLPFHKIGFHNPTQNFNPLLSQKTDKAKDLKFVRMVHQNKSPLKSLKISDAT